jgi:hypothetical protein
MKKDRKYIFIFILTLAAFTFFEWLKPKPIDWSPSYSKRDKIPFGNFVLYSRLETIFPGKKITPVTTSVYENTDTIGKSQHTGNRYNYIIITNNFNPGETDLNSLLAFVDKGNNVFIASNEYPDFIKDSLHFKMDDFYEGAFASTDSISKADSLSLLFANPSLNGKYYYQRERISSYFSSFDTSNTIVLGFNGEERVTFIKIKHGNGNLFLSSTPRVFTNFYMLKDNNSDYVAKALSYLPVYDVFWDEHFKRNRLLASSPLKVILSYEPLRWAYYLIIFSILLFILFEAKRRQRIIPIIEPLRNSTLEFTDTIGRLYYQHGNHKDIALKKITYFMDFVRNKFYLKTNNMDKEFAERLSEKSGRSLEDIRKLIAFIEKINQKSSISEEELMQLNGDLEEFYK